MLSPIPRTAFHQPVCGEPAAVLSGKDGLGHTGQLFPEPPRCGAADGNTAFLQQTLDFSEGLTGLEKKATAAS